MKADTTTSSQKQDDYPWNGITQHLQKWRKIELYSWLAKLWEMSS